MNLSQETTRQLFGFGVGVLSPAELEQWVVGAQDDEQFLLLERDALRDLRLMLLECGEGQREVRDVQARAWALLSDNGAPNFSTNSNHTEEVTEITILAPPEGSVVPAL